VTSVPPDLIIAVATALGSAFTAIYMNRRRINELRSWAWGRERDETDQGFVGDQRSLNEQIESIEGKLDSELEERRQDHREVEREVRRNRAYFSGSIENLADTLNDQLSEAEIDVDEDVEPDWGNRDHRGPD